MALFLLGAAEEFAVEARDAPSRSCRGFCRLDRDTYDADALVHLEDYLLAGHFDAETLQLAEHFLPAAREGVRTVG